jgi:anion-transporting  ArsA/GET3 family ATPase
MFGGFRHRADETYRILQDPQTAFLLVAAPERDAVREAAYFAERLVAERMPLAGLVLNRMHRSVIAELSAERSEEAASALAADEQSVTADARRVHAALMRQTEREVRVATTFTDAFPAVPTVAVTAQPADVHDVDGLRTIGALLAA